MTKKAFYFESISGFGRTEMKTVATTETEAATHAACQQFGRGSYARKGVGQGVYVTGHQAGSQGQIKRIEP